MQHHIQPFLYQATTIKTPAPEVLFHMNKNIWSSDTFSIGKKKKKNQIHSSFQAFQLKMISLKIIWSMNLFRNPNWQFWKKKLIGIVMKIQSDK